MIRRTGDFEMRVRGIPWMAESVIVERRGVGHMSSTQRDRKNAGTRMDGRGDVDTKSGWPGPGFYVGSRSPSYSNVGKDRAFVSVIPGGKAR